MFEETCKKIHEYCMSKPCAYESRPFGELPICYRVAGKIFAQFSPKEDWFKMTLKTNPNAAEFYRMIYPDVVVRGYHCPPVQQPYWNTVEINKIEEEILLQMIDEAYDEVVKGLPKKEQGRLQYLSEFQFIKTNGENQDFVQLCKKLDDNLNDIVGGKKQRQQYIQYNKLDSIHDVIVIYHNSIPIGCGAYKLYDDETCELKRIYLEPMMRGSGLAKELMRRLEADARIEGYRYAILETGEPLVEAIGLYKKMGYKIIPNYGQYVNLLDSICMSKKL